MFWQSPSQEKTNIAPETTYIPHGGLELKAQSIPHLLALHAQERGDSTFIETWDEEVKKRISFRTIFKQSVAKGKFIQETFGVADGDKCAILSPNSPQVN
jgi:acyl-coenzyme A synthetase/AMP-(fatty) acid ligase